MIWYPLAYLDTTPQSMEDQELSDLETARALKNLSSFVIEGLILPVLAVFGIAGENYSTVYVYLEFIFETLILSKTSLQETWFVCGR